MKIKAPTHIHIHSLHLSYMYIKASLLTSTRHTRTSLEPYTPLKSNSYPVKPHRVVKTGLEGRPCPAEQSTVVGTKEFPPLLVLCASDLTPLCVKSVGHRTRISSNLITDYIGDDIHNSLQRFFFCVFFCFVFVLSIKIIKPANEREAIKES